YRGYDPTPYLPVFKGWIVGSAEISERFLHDYRKTVADCMADEHYGRLTELSKAHNMVTRCESAGPSWSGTICMDGLKNLGRSEFPQGEFWQDGTFVENNQNKVAKMAASAGHIYGKRYVAAEAFTDGRPGSKEWQNPISRLKPIADRAFCEGINQVVFHTMTCQKPSEGKPGLEYGAGTHFNPNVTWWDQAAGSWIGYINRCQALLQSGLFVADVLYYNGDWAPNLVGPKEIEQAGLGKGYDYDVCNAEVLLTRLSVKDGRIVLPACPSELGERSRDGMSYRVLVLPETQRMPAEVANKIKELVQAGATVVGPKPESDPGLKDYPNCDAEVKKIAAEVWGSCDGQQVKQNTFGKGRVFWGKTLGEIFQADGVSPDFTYTGDAFIDFIHRSADGAEIYFLANRKNMAASVEANFRVTGMQPEQWDPLSGARRDLQVFTSKDGRTSVPLEFEPDGSMFIVFRKPLAITAVQSGGTSNFYSFEAKQEISGPWTVQFDPQWFYPTDGLSGDQAKGLMTFDKLEDWTQRAEPAVKHFSGTAVYRKSFEVTDASMIGKASSPIHLDLGVVKDTAKVKLNGKDLGVVWCHPWRVDISKAIKAGQNQLEIEVVNLWPNRMIGDSGLPEAQRRTRTNMPLDAKGKLLPSGLLGPVKICTQALTAAK
ncbi:MAG TPA: glycosyl hydrolase, partial [Luteolibacter sp.]|nr:glycosyl hydrolase [Luteolibacter sp.]